MTYYQDDRALPSRHYDADLALELAEHCWLVSHGWGWGVLTFTNKAAEFVWIAPAHHRGSQRYYESRAHAVNSQKKNYPRGDLHGKDQHGY